MYESCETLYCMLQINQCLVSIQTLREKSCSVCGLFQLYSALLYF